MKKVNVLGTDYLFDEDDLNNENLAENDGVCELYEKEIVVRKREYMPGNTEAGKEKRYQHVIRHELIHAFAQESGVPYGDDEALVDWFAHMIPMINKAYEKVVAGD